MLLRSICDEIILFLVILYKKVKKVGRRSGETEIRTLYKECLVMDKNKGDMLCLW